MSDPPPGDIELSPLSISNITRHRPPQAYDVQSDLGNDDETGHRNRLEIFRYLTRHSSLDRSLENPHITGIAISGTIGIGLFIRTGQVISLAGGLGSVIAYAVGGTMVTCVMLCLSEMVSFRHEAGAIFEYPKLFVSHALGFAVGIIYWLSYTTGLVTLIVSAGQLLDLESPGQTAGAMVCVIIVITLANVLGGVQLYGNLEWAFKWFKILVIVSLWVLMIYININSAINTRYWDTAYLFPPGFNGVPANTTGTDADATYADLMYENVTQGAKTMEIDGTGGTFLGVITAINVAMFGFAGVEILIVAAGEAKNARRDLPNATSYTYIITIALYLISALTVSFNVSYDDPDLPTYGGVSGKESSSNSPFIIAMSRSTLNKQVGETFKWLFFVSAATTANTNVYVSSRTLFALAANSNVHWARERLGRTSQGKTPLWAIGVSLMPCLLALTGISYGGAYGNPTTVVNVFSEICTVSFLCVHAAECWTFIQFMKGLGDKRNQESYTRIYKRIPRQPLFAWCGFLSCLFFILINGWHNIFEATLVGIDRARAQDVVVGLIASYFGPTLFAGLFISYKLINRMPRQRDNNFWALRSKDPPSTTLANTAPGVPVSRLRKIWRYT